MLKSALVVLVLLAQSFAATTVTPTTTLAIETGNNTSGAGSFQTSTNGNLAPANVSKQSIRGLLYAGATSKIYAHYLGWFGGTNHISIGYDSATLAQAHNQISDMMSRGIDGLIIDWYGAGSTRINQASLYVKQDAETRAGKFEFAIMEDQGAVHNCAYTAGCDATQALINDFNYIINTYASSPAYMRVNGQPVIFTFDTENLPNIDWTKVMATVQGNPKIVLRNDPGFRTSYTSGSYSWVNINKANPGDWGQGYLDDFYATGKSYPTMWTYAGVWKGFNDTAASWSENRVVNQNCGQTWLATFNEMNRYFSAGYQAPAVQLVTWNDYEEGTEIETGIDNCVSVSASVNNGVVSWMISGGQENTIDHYSVFVSLDGQNLMKLADVATGVGQLSLSGYGFAGGNYTVYVKAVGKASIRNQMSAAVPFTIANQSPTAALSVTPNNANAPVTVTASTAGSKPGTGSITVSTIDFGDGTVMNATTAGHIYSKGGTYMVKAWVTDGSGMTASASSSLTVTNVFQVNAISPADGSMVTGPVHFAASTTSTLPVSALRIYVDNNSMYTVDAATMDTTLVLTPGKHYVVLQGWDSSGLVAKTPLNITVVNQAPTVNLVMTPTSGWGPLTISATALGSDADGTVTATAIDFGDGTVFSGVNGLHTYTQPGAYLVVAKVTDNNGATTTVTGRVNVWSTRITPQRPTRGAVAAKAVTGPVTVVAAAPAPVATVSVDVDETKPERTERARR